MNTFFVKNNIISENNNINKDLEENNIEDYSVPEDLGDYQKYDVLKINIEYYLFFIVVILLSIIGIIMVSSASIAVGQRYFNDAFYFIRRQAIWWLASILALMLFSKVNYKFYPKISTVFILLSIGLLGIVIIPGVAPVIGGSRRWFNFFFFNLQPSEIVKISLILFIASSLTKRYIKRPYFKNIIWPSFITLIIITILIFLQPDFGTVVVIWAFIFSLFFIANVRIPHILILGSIGLVGLIIYMFAEDYRRERIFAFLNISAQPTDINFQVNQSLIALGSGNIFGLGLGNSLQKFSYLPEAHTDFIFAIIGEELGLLGTIIVIILFIAFTFLGIRICQKSKDYFGRVISGALTLMITVQAAINISVVIGILPVTGMPLPFISYGGSSLLTCMIASGIILNISRQNYSIIKKSSLEIEE